MENWKVESWSLPDVGMVHIVITDGNNRISKNYVKAGAFFTFMFHHGLLDEYAEIKRQVWG